MNIKYRETISSNDQSSVIDLKNYFKVLFFIR